MTCPQPLTYAPPYPGYGDVMHGPEAWTYDQRMFARLQAVDNREIPEFEGNPEDVNDYMRKIEVFQTIDTADPRTQAVWLLSNLKGIAWTNAIEVMSPEDLCCDQGVDIFKSYIRLTYGKFELQQQSAIMEEFMEKCHRKNSEEHRAFGGRYKTLLAKLKRSGVVIPNSLAAFVYWHTAARLSETQRQQVLVSTGNRCVLDDMMEAVAIQYPHTAMMTPQGVNHTFGNDMDLDTDVEERQQKQPRGGHEGGHTNWMAGAPRVSAHTSEDVAAFFWPVCEPPSRTRQQC